MLALRAPVLVLVFVQDQLVLKLVHGPAGLGYEPAQIPGHLRELGGTEDYEREEPNDHQFLRADAEHDANITREFAGYNALEVLAEPRAT